MKKYLLLALLGIGSICLSDQQGLQNFVDGLMTRCADPVFSEQAIEETIQHYVEVAENPFGVYSIPGRCKPYSHRYANLILNLRATALDYFLLQRQLVSKIAHAKKVPFISKLLSNIPPIENVETVIILLQEVGFKQTISVENLDLLAQVFLCEELWYRFYWIDR